MRGGVEVELIQPALREGALQAGLNPFIERVGGAISAKRAAAS